MVVVLPMEETPRRRIRVKPSLNEISMYQLGNKGRWEGVRRYSASPTPFYIRLLQIFKYGANGFPSTSDIFFMVLLQTRPTPFYTRIKDR
jgi:hypothetical protein